MYRYVFRQPIFALGVLGASIVNVGDTSENSKHPHRPLTSERRSSPLFPLRRTALMKGAEAATADGSQPVNEHGDHHGAGQDGGDNASFWWQQRPRVSLCFFFLEILLSLEWPFGASDQLVPFLLDLMSLPRP